MQLTLREKTEDGPFCWAWFTAHLDKGDIEIKLWENPWGKKESSMDLAHRYIRASLENGGITLGCGKVVVDIVNTLRQMLEDPPENWVIGALHPEQGNRCAVSYAARMSECPEECSHHFFQPIQHWLDQGMSKEQILTMFNN